jgi:hypothetical protein
MRQAKKHTAEEIIPKLRAAELEIAKGRTAAEAAKKIGVTATTGSKSVELWHVPLADEFTTWRRAAETTLSARQRERGPESPARARPHLRWHPIRCSRSGRSAVSTRRSRPRR